MHTGLDLFSLPPTQTAVEDGQFVEHYPLSSISPSAPIEFVISGSTEDYTDLCNTFLHLRAKVTKADGTPLDADAKVLPINNWLHTLFSQVDVSLNDTLVSASENTYAYRAYLETLLNTSKEAKEGPLTVQLYYQDARLHYEDTDGNDNPGAMVRKSLAAESKEIDMMGRLHTDIAHQEKFILPGVDIKFRLLPSKSEFNLLADAAAGACRAVITHASLFVRKAKVNPAIALAHEKTLENATAKYPMKRVNLKTFSIPTGQLSHVQDNLFLSQTPTRLIIGFVDTAAFNGNYTQNPFNFQTYKLTYLCISLDGRQVPAKGLTPDFDNNQFARAFHGLMTAIGVTNHDRGIGVEYR